MASIPLQNVTKLLRKARREGSASTRYRAEYDSSTDTMSLYHYGTLIFRSRNRRVVALGGYSNSDRDAIASAMDVMNTDYQRVSGAQNRPSWAENQIDGWWVA